MTNRSTRSTSTGRRPARLDFRLTPSTPRCRRPGGSSYVNQFIDGGRVKRVFVQGDAPYRMRPEDFGRWYVRNGRGDTAPFSAFASGHWTHGPPKLERYNGTASIEILGRPASGHSTGEAMQDIEHLIA